MITKEDFHKRVQRVIEALDIQPLGYSDPDAVMEVNHKESLFALQILGPVVSGLFVQLTADEAADWIDQVVHCRRDIIKDPKGVSEREHGHG